jgi:hypothetical protein
MMNIYTRIQDVKRGRARDRGKWVKVQGIGKRGMSDEEHL